MCVCIGESCVCASPVSVDQQQGEHQVHVNMAVTYICHREKGNDKRQLFHQSPTEEPNIDSPKQVDKCSNVVSFFQCVCVCLCVCLCACGYAILQNPGLVLSQPVLLGNHSTS